MAELVMQREYYYYPARFITRVMSGVFGILQALLALRLVLLFLGANATSPFVAWIYDISGRFVAPFAGAFPALSLAGFVIDFSTIFAMFGYAILSWFISYLLSFAFLD